MKRRSGLAAVPCVLAAAALGACSASSVTLTNESDRVIEYRMGRRYHTSFGTSYGWDWDRPLTLRPSETACVLTSNLDNNNYYPYEMVSIATSPPGTIDQTVLLKINGTAELRLGVDADGRVKVLNDVPTSWSPFNSYLVDPKETPSQSK